MFVIALNLIGALRDCFEDLLVAISNIANYKGYFNNLINYIYKYVSRINNFWDAFCKTILRHLVRYPKLALNEYVLKEHRK